MAAPAFPLETALGWFSLTVVDEQCIIARAPAAGGAMLLDGEELGVQAELRPDQDGVWRPRQRGDLLVIQRRRGAGSAQADREPDPRLDQMIVEALAEAVTEWASASPVLLAAAAALNRDQARQCAPRVSIQHIRTEE